MCNFAQMDAVRLFRLVDTGGILYNKAIKAKGDWRMLHGAAEGRVRKNKQGFLHDEQLGKVVTLLTAENKRYAYPAGVVLVAQGEPVRLRMQLQSDDAFCSYSVGDGAWQPIGGALDATALSDEACAEGWFTGTMVGLCCQDVSGARQWADFAYFTYHPEREDAR